MSTPVSPEVERIPVRVVRSRHAKKLVRDSVHHQLRVAIIGTGPVSCALARALGRSAFVHVAQFTNTAQLATYAYVRAALFEKAFAFARASAFPGSEVQMMITRARVKLKKKIKVDATAILRIDPERKEIHLSDKRIHAYDVLLIPHDAHPCALEERDAETHQYVGDGDALMALHTFFANKVALTPKRDPIDITCDASSRMGHELMQTLAVQLPEFAARYGHPKETVHIHDVADGAHEAEAKHAIHVHVHAKLDGVYPDAGIMLAHSGHILLPSFGAGLTGVDVTHAVLAHLALHPMRSVRFDDALSEEKYLGKQRAVIRGRKGFLSYLRLRTHDLWRAIRAYGLLAGVRAWRGLKI